MRSRFALIFAASGAAALIYEVTWTRMLTLQLGHGTAAASTVLAAFMGGLAAGSAIAGRRSATLEPVRALRLYAQLELVIAGLALVLPFAINAVDPLLAPVYADGAGGTPFAMLRLGTSLILLSIPAAAMGATFPVAARWFVQRTHLAARDAGTLYAANTVGAALGALAAGFLLLPAIGLAGATWIGIGLNVVAAGAALAISKSPTAASQVAATPASGAARGGARGARAKNRGASAPLPDAVGTGRPYLAASALGISGFASLTMQVVWSRLLALILGPTTYAFSTMVAVFIAGLAIGAAVASRLVARTRQPIVGLALSVALAVGCAAVSAALVDRGLLAIAEVVARPGVTFGEVLGRQALLAVALLAPMTIAFGAAFPFAVAVGARSDRPASSDLGLIYAVNTAGAVAGALAAGFALLPWAGLHGTIRIVTAVGAIASLGLVMMGAVPRRQRILPSAVALAVLALAVLLPRWDPLLLSSGAYKYASAMQAATLETALTAGDLLYYKEGPSGTVAVRRVTGTTSLAIDGKVDASNAGDMLTQRMLAHVPLLLHPNPRRVAILGLGSGVTLGAALTHPLERADVLEISPEVVAASRFFERENHGALDDPRTRLVVGDGRTHLLLARERYDVIVSEPSNPWMAGIASLFTREFFQAARARLAPGGILCQWAHTYDISTRDLQSIVATFLSVFPDGTLWLVGDGDVLLVGSNEPLEPRLATIEEAWRRPDVSADLAAVGALEPFHVLSMFVAQGQTLVSWAGDAPIQSDNRAGIEFSGPRSVFGGTTDDNAGLLRALARNAGGRPAAIRRVEATASATAIRDRGWMLLRADAVRPAFDDFARAAEAEPSNARTLDGLIRASAPISRGADAQAILTRLAANPEHTEARLALARLRASQGDFDEGARMVFAILQSNPGNVAALEAMASILADLSDVERLRPIVSRLRVEAPASEAAHYYSAALLFMENRVELALNEARQVLALNPTNAKAHNLAGACLASLGQREQARAAFEASIEADPRDPATYANLATLELEAGNRERAAKYFAEALTIDPLSDAARRGLAGIQQN